MDRREELKAQINEKLNKLSDEELKKVSGGSTSSNTATSA